LIENQNKNKALNDYSNLTGVASQPQATSVSQQPEEAQVNPETAAKKNEVVQQYLAKYKVDNAKEIAVSSVLKKF
jgi:hypothetical protein